MSGGAERGGAARRAPTRAAFAWPTSLVPLLLLLLFPALPEARAVAADWTELLPELAAAQPERRRAAEAALRRALQPAEVAPLLDEFERWPPTIAVALERTLIELPRLRAALLHAALRSDRASGSANGAARARELLAIAWEQRAGELAPWRPELATLRERRLPWSEPGWRALRSGPPRARLSLLEVEAALRRAGALERSLLLFPGLLAEGIEAPLAAEVAADGWLELELARRDVAVVRGWVATWLLPRELADAEGLSETEKGGVELERWRERERRWLLLALERCATLPLADGGRAAGALLLRLGMPWIEGTSGVAVLDAALAAALHDWRGAPDGSARPVEREFPPPPLASGAELRAELATFLAQAPAAGAALSVETAAERALAWRVQLRELVDRAAGRPRDEVLLCGAFSEALRQSAAASDQPAWQAACERAAAEFWLLGRCERPGRALLQLPSGAPPR